MTNYERIKNMSIEEMAELFADMTGNIAIKLFGKYVCNDIAFIKQSLESEADEEA